LKNAWAIRKGEKRWVKQMNYQRQQGETFWANALAAESTWKKNAIPSQAVKKNREVDRLRFSKTGESKFLSV